MADASLNTWAIAWVAHTLPRDPGRLFNAPIFYPSPLTFAYSEPLIVQGVMAMPVLAAGGSPVLAYNVVLLAGFTLTAWTIALLVLRATASIPAALVAGSAGAFNAHNLLRLPHLQALHLEFLPLALLALDRLLADARLRHAVLLAGAVVLQGLASIYALAFTGWALLSAVIAWPRVRSGRTWKTLGLLVLAMLITMIALAPVLYPYYFVSHTLGLVRTVGEALVFSSTWTDYLYTGATFHFNAWSHRFAGSSDANFPGITVMLLAGVGIARGWRGNRHVRMAAGVVIGAVLLSVLPRLPGFESIHDHVPMLGAIRGYSRAGQIALVGLAILAGLGLAELEARLKGRPSWALVAGGALLLVNVEALRAPLTYVPFTGISEVYAAIGGPSNGPMLELPIFGPTSEHRNAPYMVSATKHWRPMVNGYSGFLPPGYGDIYDTLRVFPDAASIAWLREHQVTTVVLHRAEFERWKGAAQRERVESCPALELTTISGDIRVFRVRP